VDSAGAVGTGSASLFTYSDNPGYLFCTDTGFASEAALYDSSWFFTRIDPDHATTLTRIGAGPV
jgi:hypothetical protein